MQLAYVGDEIWYEVSRGRATRFKVMSVIDTGSNYEYVLREMGLGEETRYNHGTPVPQSSKTTMYQMGSNNPLNRRR